MDDSSLTRGSIRNLEENEGDYDYDYNEEEDSGSQELDASYSEGTSEQVEEESVVG